MLANIKILQKPKSAFLVVVVVLQVITFVTTQSPPALVNYDISPSNVSTKVDDYILENRLQYNATLHSYLYQIEDVKDSLEDRLKGLDKQKVLLLNTIKETNEKINPLEVLSLPTKYCVQLYRSVLPYADIVKANLESCITNARSYANSIVNVPTNQYNILYRYYNTDLKNNLNNCEKLYNNSKLNYTICVTEKISQANAYTIKHRKDFAAAIESSRCSVNSRLDTALSCTYTYFSSALSSIGAATRLIDDCIHGYLRSRPIDPEANNTTNNNGNNNGIVISTGCPNVIYVESKDGVAVNNTMVQTFQRTARSLDCLEIRYI